MQIDSLIQQFDQHGIDYYLVPTTDEFLSEYAPDHLKRLKYLTGFDGSNGIAIIGKTQKALFTDGRYLLQASKQLGEDFEILDITDGNAVNQYLKSLGQGTFGYNPFIFSLNQLKPFDIAECYLRSVKLDLVDTIWQREFEIGDAPYEFGEKFCGESSASKIKRLLERLDESADYIFITEPEAICWLLNLRGSDLKYSPLVLSHLLVSKAGEIELFSPHESICGYHHTPLKQTREVPFLQKVEKKVVQVDFSRISKAFLDIFEGFVVNTPCPVNSMKMIKNKVEIEGFRQAHKKDGKILEIFLNWLETECYNGHTEYELGKKLNLLRAEDPDFLMPSFDPIVGYGSNGAIIHYSAVEGESKCVMDEELLLIDSGGHYKCGTTDVTRTIHLGEPTAEQRKMFTLVLKGQIALSMAEFEVGATGDVLDAIARQFLVAEGFDYAHGTGHGVGHVLSVHEGPCRISKLKSIPLEAGMVLSNEPGYYKNGEYGIRHENLMVVVPSEREGYLKFETLTCVPVQEKMVDMAMLSDEERAFVGLLS